MDPKAVSYGQATPGQPGLSRFQIEGGPTPGIMLFAAGSMVIDVPAHNIGNRGSAYFYGSTKVKGTTNMLSNGEELRPILVDGTVIPVSAVFPTRTLLLGGTGVGSYNELSNTKHCQVLTGGADSYQLVDCNGEKCYQDTTTASGDYGAAKEQFVSAGTVSVTNGSAAVSGAGTAFTTAVLSFSYSAYAPGTASMNFVVPGDLIEIIQAGVSYFHRIAAVGSPTTLNIYPDWNGTDDTGLTYKIWRTGYGSFSRSVILRTGLTWTLYYCGNTLLNLGDTHAVGEVGLGTIQAVNTVNHFMAPQLSPSGTELCAVDIIYYKGYLLYMGGGAIGWSAAGFPTEVLIAFSGTDFDDDDISVIAQNDQACYFEAIGDQLYAFFRNSVWQVNATGSVPAFNFTKVPQKPGALNRGVTDPQGVLFGGLEGISYMRGITSASASIYYISEQGLMEIRGAPPAAEISPPVHKYDWPGLGNLSYLPFDLSYDGPTDSLIWMDGHARGMMLRRGDWSVLDLTDIGEVKAVVGGMPSREPSTELYRRMGVAYWNPSDSKLYIVSTSIDQEATTQTNGNSLCNWYWATPIIDLGRQPDFRYGGFHVIARGPSTGTIDANFNWEVYGGKDPYNMAVLDSGNFLWSSAPMSIDVTLGAKVQDQAFMGFRLYGTFWIALTGIWVWNANVPSGR